MENINQEQFEKDTDVVITIVTHKNEQDAAAEQALFDIAVAAGAAQYKYHQKRMRRLFHWLNQLGMILTGVLMLVTVLMCCYDGGWYTLVYMFSTVFTCLFSRWCYRKSCSKKVVV